MSRWLQSFLALLFVLIISAASFTAGIVVERGGMLPGSLKVEPPELTKQFSVFWQAWDLAQKNFVDRSAVDSENLTYGAIEGMVAALGDTGHSRFLTPEEMAMQTSDISGQFQGIGAELGVKDGYPVIVAPMDGSPAEKAGILAGDILVEVNDVPVVGVSLDRVVRMVRGPEGTEVKLKVIHPGASSVTEITIVRGNIKVNPVSWVMVPGRQTALIRISQFSAVTTSELISAVKSARAANATGVVVDMRGNTGGLLDQCISTISQFISGGDALLEQNAQGERKSHPVQPGGVATDIPMVVLINQGTASAGEIFAGAMQDYGRAQLVGETTFGTGTVLTPYPLSDGSALLLGTSQWLTPKGRQIWKHGVEPDVKLALPAAVAPLSPRKVGEMNAEAFLASQDTQLLKALELLK